MDVPQFRTEIQAWLKDSGKLKEMQTRLRSEMIQQLRSGKKQIQPPSRPPSAKKLALNTLILEQLMRSECWYSASILASEAHFPDDSAPPMLDPGPLNRDTFVPQKLSDESLSQILSQLEMPSRVDSETLRIAYYRNPSDSLLEVLLQTLAGQDSGTLTSRPMLEKLDQIEALIRSKRDKNRDHELLNRLDHLKANLDKRSDTGPENYDSVHSVSEEGSSVASSSSRGLDTGATESRTARDNTHQAELEALKNELALTRRELDTAKATQSDLQDLKLIIASQKGELDRLRSALEVREAHKPQIPTRDLGFASAATNRQPSTRCVPQTESGVGDFLHQIRSKVDHLYQTSVSIDKEFSELN